MADNTSTDGLNKCTLETLIEAVITTGSGEWKSNKFSKNASVEITTTGSPTGLSVTVCGSNSPTKPLTSDDGSTIGSAITAAGITAITTPCRWVKAKVGTLSGGTAPTVTARLHQIQ